MVAVQNLKGEIIQLILSRKGGGMYLVSATPTKLLIEFLYPRSTKGEGGILFYLCPSKIFFGAFFSVTIDGRNLIFGHKHHIGIPYCG